ncbi:hypothetical protein T459_15077 [Capsicum annuum]|uniref:Transposase-associated domain-containing protein n=1 Tax=Capsicum annuum TaxID=4072 RepID=A0A2G2ZJ95_CAPAN|nr:hypothetical protein T459_15077 [Capsicum annuum]
MTIPEHQKRMINRLLPGKVAYTDEFIKGMEEFIKFACSQPKYLSEKVIRCPCKICKNMKHFTPDEVNVHIFKKGFAPGYWYWTSHGEEAPSINLNEHVHSSASTSHRGCSFDMSSSSQTNILAEVTEHVLLVLRLSSDEFQVLLVLRLPSDQFQVLLVLRLPSITVGGLKLRVIPVAVVRLKNEFERKKQEKLAVQSASAMDGETNSASQLTQLKIDEMIKSQVDASNTDLYSQLQTERKKNKRMRKELHLLMKHVYNKSSSNNERPSQEDYQAYEDESYDDSDDVNGSDNPDNVNESDFDPDGLLAYVSAGGVLGLVQSMVLVSKRKVSSAVLHEDIVNLRDFIERLMIEEDQTVLYMDQIEKLKLELTFLSACLQLCYYISDGFTA